VRKSREFGIQLKRTLGHVYYRGADVGEAIAAAERVKEGDFEGWYTVWSGFAEQIASLACESDPIGARDCYFRATEYMRQALFFLRANLSDPRIRDGSEKIQRWFSKAIKEERWDIRPISSPYMGYFGRAGGGTRPLVIIIGGYDSVAEELYFTGGYAALERGYHTLFFDGPGQGHALYQKGEVMRPDWENVIAGAIDWAAAQDGVDPNAIALIGHSLGGYFAPRSASSEHRLKAVVANPGQMNLLRSASHFFPGELWDRFCASDARAFNSEIERAMERNKSFGFKVASRMSAHDATSPYEWVESLASYTLEGRAERITCPTLICESGEEHLSSGSAKALFKALTCEKELIRFTKDEGAGDHCEALAQALLMTKIFNWLGQHLPSLSAV